MRAEAESHGPIRYLINTENHVDHIFGNYWFRGAGEVVNHKGLWDIFMDPKAALDPFDYALEAIPTDDPDGAALIPDRDEYYADLPRGTVVFTGDLTPARRRPHDPLPLDAGAHAGAARGPRPRGTGRVHRRHDLLGLPDLADDLERRPVARGARDGSGRSTSTTWSRGMARSSTLDYVADAAGGADVLEGGRRGRGREGLVARGDDRARPVRRRSSGRSTSGRRYMMDHIQNNNAGSLWDKLTATGYAKGR